MYLSLLKIKNFRCFDGNEHIIAFNKGLNVLVGENDSGKSTIMDAIKIVLGTTDMNWHRIVQEDFYKEDVNLEIEIMCKFEDLNEDESGAFLECLSYEDVDKKVPCLYLHWRCKFLTSFKPPRPVANISTGKDGNGTSPSVEAKELLRTTYLRALRDAYSEMQSGKRSRLSQIMQHVSVVDQGENEYQEGKDIHRLSIAGIADLSNKLLAHHPALDSINREMTTILQEKMLLKKDNIKTRLEVAGANSNRLQKEMALLEKLDLAVDKNAGEMCGKVGLGTSNIMSMACELLLHKEAEGENKSSFLLIEEPEAHIHAQRQLKLIQSLENECHVVGMVHDKKEETLEKQFPKGIYNYWNSYEAKKTNKRVVHQYLIEYFRIGINEFENTGEKAIQVEWICKGIRRLINKAKECNYIAATKNTLAALLDFLIEEEKSVFRNGLMELKKFQGEIGKDEWRTIVLILKQILKLYNITSYEKIKKFGQWKKGEETQNVLDDESDIKLLPNHYLYKNLQTNRFVDIEFGSIHSVKGRTHLATLVVETYLRTHNMKSILKYLCGMPSKGNPANEKRLKCQYVAMTRARALICLAIPIDFVDNKMQKKLTQLGWFLKVIE